MSLARLRALIVLGVLAAAATITVVWAIAQDSKDDGPDKNSCAVEKAATTIPQPAQVTVKVLNGTDKTGRALEVRKKLEERGFVVVEHANAREVTEGTALVRYGPRAAGSAQLVRAQIPDAVAAPDERDDDVVELVIGPDFADLTPADQVQRVVNGLGDPVLPSPSCSKDKGMM